MLINQIKKIKCTPIIIIAIVSLFTMITGNALFNNQNLMVAKGATPPASITSRVGWVGNTNRGVKVNNIAAWYTSDQITPGVQDLDVMPDGSFVANTYSEEGYQNISTYNPDGTKKKSGYIPGSQDGGHSGPL